MTIIEQARQLLASLEALSMPDTQVAALCRALIVRTEALRELVGCADSLRDFVAEGGSRHMIGATAAIIEADRAIDAASRALADEPHTGQGD